MIKEKSVLVLGVGPDQGLGVALCKQFAEEGYRVFGCGRNKENMDALKNVKVSKGSIEGIVGDVTNPEDVLNIFSQLDEAEVKLESVIYNAGNNNAKPFLEMDLDFFQDLWEVCAKGAFLISQQAIPRLMDGGGSLLFTGATASIRSKPPFTAFAAAKSAERSLAQGLAKEFGPKGIHVAHTVIDGAIDHPWIKENFPDIYKLKKKDGILKPNEIAQVYLDLHNQQKSVWTHEIDLRPYMEKF